MNGYNWNVPSVSSSSQSLVSDISARRRLNEAAVLHELEAMHRALEPGDAFPSRRELMGRLDTPENVLRGALEEFERRGKIIRRVGRGGSVVADPLGRNGQANGNSLVQHLVQNFPLETESPSIMAIGEPDSGVFDQAMRVLMKQAKRVKMIVNCRFMYSDEIPSFAIPSAENGARSFVVFRPHFLPLAQRLRDAGHHVVFIGTPFNETQVGVPSVSGDQEQGGYLAVRHLLELGHRHIAFHFGDNYEKLRRWVGCRRALEEAYEAGLDVQHEILDWSVVVGWKSQPQQLQEYFVRPNAPTGIISWNDTEAIGLLTLLMANGIQVPKQVSLVGYDNLVIGAEVHPALTTVDGLLTTQIQAALRFLAHPSEAVHHTIVTPALVNRESTAPPFVK